VSTITRTTSSRSSNAMRHSSNELSHSLALPLPLATLTIITLCESSTSIQIFVSAYLASFKQMQATTRKAVVCATRSARVVLASQSHTRMLGRVIASPRPQASDVILLSGYSSPIRRESTAIADICSMFVVARAGPLEEVRRRWRKVTCVQPHGTLG